jgi:hypothetical protein
MDFNIPSSGAPRTYPKVHNELTLMVEEPLIYFYCLSTASSYDMTFQDEKDLALTRGVCNDWLLVQSSETWLVFADYMCVTELGLLAGWDTFSGRVKKMINEYPEQKDKTTDIAARQSHAWCDKVVADGPSFEKDSTKLINEMMIFARPKSR